MSDLTTLEDLHDDEVITPTGDDQPANEPEEPSNDPNNPRQSAPADEPEPSPEPSEEPSVEPDNGQPAPTDEPKGDMLDVSGIDQFLAQYGIMGGIINFEGEGENGETIQKHFNELDPEEQVNVLSELAQSGAPALYTPQEQRILDLAKENDMPLDQLVNELALQRAEQILAIENSNSIDYKEMSDDAIIAKWLKDNNPEASETELSDELERSKNSPFFEKNAKSIRDQYIADQMAQSQAEENARREAEFQEIEQDRARIVDAASNINDIMGFSVTDEVKNEVLEDLLEVNEYGDSLFMQDVFGNPETLFKAAWLVKNAESHFDELETYWKKQADLKYREGFNNARNGLPTASISGVGNSSAGNEPRKVKEDVSTLEDLHED